MSARPIIFSAPMVRAILDGRKTQTRRVVKPQPAEHTEVWNRDKGVAEHPTAWFENVARRCPYGKPGTVLWVRETWAENEEHDDGWEPEYNRNTRPLFYRADREVPDLKWRPSIFMPRWASRITLKVEEVRVQRLWDISEQDALAEGVLPEVRGCSHPNNKTCRLMCAHPLCFSISSREGYEALWDSLNAKKHPWSSNPWVFAITFKRIG